MKRRIASVLNCVRSMIVFLHRYKVTNLNGILKCTDIILNTNMRIMEAIVFPVITYGSKSWAIRKPERRRVDAFELLKKTVKSILDASRSNESILK